MTPVDLQELTAMALEEIAGADSLEGLDEVRLRYLGRRDGLVTLAGQRLRELSPDQRAAYGQEFNRASGELRAALETRQRELAAGEEAQREDAEWVDMSHPFREPEQGHPHPVAGLIREIEDVFAFLGYQSVAGPELEDDQHNFQLLNMPPEHPARDAHDTFYLSPPAGGWLYRTHTSPVQMRAMLGSRPPLRIIVPGRVARRDNPDPTHTPVFHQVEGLCVDRGVTLGDLKGTLEYVIRALFGRDRRVRLRASFFPYTEPSLEADVACAVCQGAGCRTCLQKGWIEILGSGMVHPEVLRNGGVDPETHSGFAFGMGPDRIAVLRYGLTDLRDLYENDLRLLECF